MNLIERFAGFFGYSKRATYRDTDGWLFDALTGGKTASGVAVSPENSLTCSAVYAAIRIMAETMGALPWLTYRRITDGKERADEHPVAVLLKTTPNDEMTPAVFRQCLIQSYYLFGNAICEIERTKSGRPVALWPLDVRQIDIKRLDGQLWYCVRNDAGEPETRLMAKDVYHVPLFSADGVLGKGLVQRARESIGLTKAIEQQQSSHFGNGATPGGVLEHPGKLSPDARKNLRAEWEAMHRGPDRSGRIAILGEGMKFAAMAMSAVDAQVIEQRKFQIGEVARWFNLPPHMLRDLDRATFSNIEQQGIEFVRYTLGPLAVVFEQEANRKLFSAAEQREMFCEFQLDGLLRGDMAARYAAYQIGRQNGWLNADEIRRWENLNPIGSEEGEAYLVNGNMIPISIAMTGGVAAMKTQSSETPTEQPTMPESTVELADDGEDDAQRMAELQASFRKAVEFHARRLVTMEVNAITRAAKDPKTFLHSVEEFYREHAGRIAELVAVQCEAWELAGGEPVDGQRVAAEYCRNAVTAIVEASGRATAETLEFAVRPVTDGRQSTAAAAIADEAVRCGGIGGKPGPCPLGVKKKRKRKKKKRKPGQLSKNRTKPKSKLSQKAQRAKDAHKLVDKRIQRYSEEHNEPSLAKKVGGKPEPDNKPYDVLIDGDKRHGIELKTMVDNKNDKITMKGDAQDRKIAWERDNKGTFHTVVYDDRKVYNANGEGKHGDESQRTILYRRGGGSFRTGKMHVVKDHEELKALINARESELPDAAKPTKQWKERQAAK